MLPDLGLAILVAMSVLGVASVMWRVLAPFGENWIYSPAFLSLGLFMVPVVTALNGGPIIGALGIVSMVAVMVIALRPTPRWLLVLIRHTSRRWIFDEVVAAGSTWKSYKNPYF